MTDDDLEKLRAQTERGSRIDTAGETPELDAFEASIAAYHAEIAAGERQKTLSAWDGPLAAFVAALADHPEVYAAVCERLAAELDVAVADPPKSELLALTLRVGFQEVADRELEALREVLQEDALEGL